MELEMTLYAQILNAFTRACMQGEDVVAGIRTPEDIDTMRQALPDAYKELLENCDILEAHYKEMMVGSPYHNVTQTNSKIFFILLPAVGLYEKRDIFLHIWRFLH